MCSHRQASDLPEVEPPRPLPPPPSSANLVDVLPYLVRLALGDPSLRWRLGAAMCLLIVSKATGALILNFLRGRALTLNFLSISLYTMQSLCLTSREVPVQKTSSSPRANSIPHKYQIMQIFALAVGLTAPVRELIKPSPSTAFLREH